MGSVDTRKALSDVIDRWERWAAGEMFLAEHLHPRARARLLDDLEAIAPATGCEFGRIVEPDADMVASMADVRASKPKGKKAGA